MIKKAAAIRSRFARRLRTPLPVGRDSFFSIPCLSVIHPRLNLLVIGSGKSGTTSLHEWLNSHPGIFMSSPLKEPHYFSIDEVAPVLGWPAGIRSQKDLFRRGMLVGYKNEPIFGESSTAYTGGGYYDSNFVPQRAYDYNKDMKLIYIVRNPIARFISQLKQGIHKNRIPSDPSQIPDSIILHHAQQSCYGRQISHWLDIFPRDQLRIVILEELSSNPRAMLNELASFLGVAPFDSDIGFEELNVDSKRKRPVGDIRLTQDLCNRIYPLITDDINLFEHHLGRDIQSIWNLDRGKWCG